MIGEDQVWTQGVGGDYSAAIDDNGLPDGTDPKAIQEMISLFELADRKCPNATLVSGGWRLVQKSLFDTCGRESY